QMSSPPPLTAPSSRPGLIQWNRHTSSPFSQGQPLALYLGDGLGGPWFALGVLEAVERYEIPLSRVVASGWGAWVGAAWAEGYSLQQIRAMLLNAHASSRKTLAKDPVEFPDLLHSLAPQGFPALHLEFSLEHDSSGATWIRPSPHPDLPQQTEALHRQLLLQEPLLERITFDSSSPNGVRVPWSVLLCEESQAKILISPDRPAGDWVFASVGIPSHQGSDKWVPLDQCTSLPLNNLQDAWPQNAWIFAFSWPERMSSDTSPRLRRELAGLDSYRDFPGIWVRPHNAISPDSISAWEQAGFDAMRSHLSELQPLGLHTHSWVALPKISPSLNQASMSFDGVSAEYQNHLSSYWPDSGSWPQRLDSFSRGVGSSPLYDSLQVLVVSQKATDLEDDEDLNVPVLAVRTHPRSHLEIAAGGEGSNLIGPQAAARLRLHWVNQMEFDLIVSGFYGESMQGILPEFRLSRVHGPGLAFSSGADLRHIDFRNWLGRLASGTASEPEIHEETRKDVYLRIHWQPGTQWELRPTVIFGHNDFYSTMSRKLVRWNYLGDSLVQAKSLEARLEWDRSRDQGQPGFFAKKGFRHWGSVGLRSVSLQTSDFTSYYAPMYAQGQARADLAWEPLSLLHLGLFAEGGLAGRIASGHWQYPEKLELMSTAGQYQDTAITERFKLHSRLTPISSQWNLSQFSSNHYLGVASSLALQLQGNGLWIFAAFFHDSEESDNTYGWKADRLTLEPLLRLHWQSLEFWAGLHRTVNLSDWDDLSSSNGWTGVLQIGVPCF
ncbi:MAG TPA: hypothetical protein VLM37_08775, partial [Fibrobacteraceae bacterium]|nr:hypothetical protein [Fibrobacteraceae bacterium]